MRDNGIGAEYVGFSAAFQELLRLTRRREYATLATASPEGQPEAAPLRYAVTDEFELVMGTLSTSRKVANLRRNPKVAVLVWAHEFSIQIEGVFDEPADDDLQRLSQRFADEFPREATVRRGRPSHLYFRITPTWARYTDFSDEPARVLTLDFNAGTETRGTWPVVSAATIP